MDWTKIVQSLVEIVILPLVSVLTIYLVTYIKAKRQEISDKIDNDTIEKYLEKLDTIIDECVIATNQTYVETLKKEGVFNEEAHKKAFQQTYDSIMSILSEEAVNILTSAVGDLTAYIKTKIEVKVNLNK